MPAFLLPLALTPQAVTLAASIATVGTIGGKFAYHFVANIIKERKRSRKLDDIEEIVKVEPFRDNIKFINNNEAFFMPKSKVEIMMDVELCNQIILEFSRLLVRSKPPSRAEAMCAVVRAKLLVE